MTKYRVLKLGEQVRADDEYLDARTGEWTVVYTAGYNIEAIHVQHRRKTLEAPSTGAT